MDMDQRNQVLLFATVSLSALAVCSILRRGKKNNHDDENGFGNDEYVVLSYFTKVSKICGIVQNFLQCLMTSTDGRHIPNRTSPLSDRSRRNLA